MKVIIYLRRDIKNCSNTQLRVYISGLNSNYTYECFKFRLNKGEWKYSNMPNYIFYNLKPDTVYQIDAEYEFNNEWIPIHYRSFITQDFDLVAINPEKVNSGGIRRH